MNQQVFVRVRFTRGVPWEDVVSLASTVVLAGASVVLAVATILLASATRALRKSQEREWARIRPRVRVSLTKYWGGGELPSGPVEFDIVNEGHQETMLQELWITIDRGGGSSTGHPVQNLTDPSGGGIGFPVRIPGAASMRVKGEIAGAKGSVTANARTLITGKVTRGDFEGQLLRDDLRE